MTMQLSEILTPNMSSWVRSSWTHGHDARCNCNAMQLIISSIQTATSKIPNTLKKFNYLFVLNIGRVLSLRTRWNNVINVCRIQVRSVSSWAQFRTDVAILHCASGTRHKALYISLPRNALQLKLHKCISITIPKGTEKRTNTVDIEFWHRDVVVSYKKVTSYVIRCCIGHFLTVKYCDIVNVD